MDEQWYVGRDGRTSGPYTSAQLAQMAAARQFLPGDLLWKPGLEQWLPLSNVKGLLPPPGTGTLPPLDLGGTVAAARSATELPGHSAIPPMPAGESAVPVGPTKTSGLAVASLVLGALSCGCSFLTGIPGIICGILGLRQIARSEREPAGPRVTGQGLAITGLILSTLMTLVAPVAIALLLPGIQAARDSARRMKCGFHLKQIGLAMIQHEDVTGLLPAAITDADGKPLLSWRVAILPYIEEKPLYERFHLDEPWDSEHNRGLIPLMPEVYVCPSADMEPGLTTYLLLDGAGAACEPKNLRAGAGGRIRGLRRADIESAAGETIMVVEAPSSRAVEWTRPAELSVSPAEAMALETDGRGHARGVRHVLRTDGTVETLRPGR